jgi:hypothetical protein
LENISPYAGGHVCNQTATGMYITLNGTILSCPGNDKENFKEGKIDVTQLHSNHSYIKKLWENTQNYKLRKGQYNCRCIAKDGNSIPRGFYKIVLDQINNKKTTILKTLLNKLEYKIMTDYYLKYNKHIGISIQLEKEEQDEYSPTRMCDFKNKHSDKLINSFCAHIQSDSNNQELCNKLDFYLKHKLLDEDSKATKNGKAVKNINGFACKCHKNISNILLRMAANSKDNQHNILLYIFIGHILVTENIDNILTKNKIQKLEDSKIELAEKKYIKADVMVSDKEIRQIFAEEKHDISKFSSDNFNDLYAFVETEITDFFHSISNDEWKIIETESTLCNEENITIPKLIKSIEKLEEEYSKLWYYSENEDKEKRKRVFLDVLNTLKENLGINQIDNWNKINTLLNEGIKGKLLDEKWQNKLMKVTINQ